MRIASIWAVIVIAVALLPASATIINIPADYLTIQQGINAGTDGDTVLVQPGTYVENIVFNGQNIFLGSMFLTSEDTSYVSQTIIDGNNNGRVVTFANYEDNTAAIIGFTIQNGYASYGAGIRCYYASPRILHNRIINNTATSFGGGMQCYTSSSLIAHNVIDGNSSYSNGGGISCGYDANATITDNIITHNSARTRGGGGIYCYSSSPLINNNTIDTNTVQGSSASGHGAGICCFYYSSPTISNNNIRNNIIDGGPTNANGGGIDCVDNSNAQITENIITGNKCLNSMGYGGGIKSVSSSPIITHNIISSNEADSACGGVDLVYSGLNTELAYNIISENISNGWSGGIGVVGYNPIMIYNNTIYGNSATRGGGFVSIWGSNPVLINNIFWANNASIEGNEIYIESGSPEITYCNIQGGWPGDSNIDLDPLFVNPVDGDFHLSWDNFPIDDETKSPCIDAGCPDSPNDPDTTCCDMGAFYFDQTPVGIRDLAILPKNIHLRQNFPNPFNASTTIHYNLPTASDITIDIYDILGRKVTTLIDRQQPAGYHQATWQADDFSSGIYFYRIKGGEFTKTKKMILLK